MNEQELVSVDLGCVVELKRGAELDTRFIPKDCFQELVGDIVKVRGVSHKLSQGTMVAMDAGDFHLGKVQEQFLEELFKGGQGVLEQLDEHCSFQMVQVHYLADDFVLNI